LSITEARDQLMRLSDEMARGQGLDAVTITKHGRPVMAVLPYEAYEALVETLSILSDPELAEALRRSVADISAGRVQDLDDVFVELGW
jgi:prevent-host-death family protein